MSASTTPPGAAPTSRADRLPAPEPKSGTFRGSVVPLAPYRAARATNDPEMLAALVEWATPEAYLRSRSRLSDPRFIASVEVVVMTLVCAFVGAMLACGGVL